MKTTHCTQRESSEGFRRRRGDTSGGKCLLEQRQPIAQGALQKPRELLGVLKCETVNLKK
jgi:hypothetical protein